MLTHILLLLFDHSHHTKAVFSLVWRDSVWYTLVWHNAAWSCKLSFVLCSEMCNVTRNSGMLPVWLVCKIHWKFSEHRKRHELCQGGLQAYLKDRSRHFIFFWLSVLVPPFVEWMCFHSLRILFFSFDVYSYLLLYLDMGLSLQIWLYFS